MPEGAGRPPRTGVVLAGGRAARFGGDKLSREVGGAPLLHHALRAVARVTSEVVVVAAAHGPDPPLPADVAVPVRVVRDTEPYPGPLAGLLAGLEAAAHPVAVVIGADMPGAVQAVLEVLAALLERSPDDVPAAALRSEGRPAPLPLAVRATAAPAIRALLEGGERSLRGFLEVASPRELPEEAWRAIDPAGTTLTDVDTPDDLPAAEALAAARSTEG